ncbi:MAG: OmpA family protein [bacterium]|nr:OmpA family protein [bacterium]MDY2830948.1 OmpA family protein [Alphaproteobacteria bacterium]
MLFYKSLKNLLAVAASVMLLSGCASAIFPDFEENNDIVVDDGGKVEVRKVKEDGILVGDKENASYEGDEDDTADEVDVADAPVVEGDEDAVSPAKVIEVKADDIAPVETAEAEDNVKVTEASADEKVLEAQDDSEPQGPSMHYLAETIYFENGGAVVDASYRSALRKLAKIVKENDATVTVYGFASSRTRDTDPATHKLANFKVSAERAENTAKALRRAGVPADKITTQAMSDSMPMYQEVMPEGERLNRRAEIYLTY